MKKEIIHGAGQSLETFQKYWNAVGKFKPRIYMLYLKIDTLTEKLPKRIKEMQSFSEELYPQIGLSLKSKIKGQQLEEILTSQYDNELKVLIRSLKELKTKVFLRIGYEFNNPSHNYTPKKFILAWKYIVDLFRKGKADNVKFVWCACTAFNKKIKEVMDFYPGDTYVDWFGNDLFGVKHFKDNKTKITEDFYQESIKHTKPFMICESSAARVGVLDGQKSWDDWFKPYFKWISQHSNIKAFCYINWDWAKDWKQPEWGNCRIEENEIVLKNYLHELKKARYIHLK